VDLVLLRPNKVPRVLNDPEAAESAKKHKDKKADAIVTIPIERNNQRVLVGAGLLLSSRRRNIGGRRGGLLAFCGIVGWVFGGNKRFLGLRRVLFGHVQDR
jgi:hypothetical protein